MRALIFRGVEDIAYESVSEPRIEAPTDALIRIEVSAICGSDLHPYFGRERGLDRGTVMGHEAVGEVVEVGPAITTIRVGDRVAMPFTTNCGQCFYCRSGLTSRCFRGQLFGWVEDGRGLHGLQAQYARVPLADSTLVQLPAGIPSDIALLLGDVMATGRFCADMAEVHEGGTYAVIGLGPVGVMAVVAAREMGAANVYGIDTVPERRALAATYGATPLTPDQAVGTVRAATDGRGADGVMEAVGSAAAERLSFELLRPGGTLAVVGVHTDPQFTFSPVDVYNRNLTYRVGRCPARHYMERLLPLLADGKYDFARLLSHHLPLSEGTRGYRIFADKAEACTKVVLTP
jgi:2-desacetyl-2-hydroxyethyl bacteriochlorophyllide A dehydrogenase